MLIAGDIGGTKTRLALVSPDAGPRKFVAEQEFHSADFKGLQPIVEAFLADAGGQATSACFDVAGPVIDGRAHLTNLPWDLEEAGAMSRPRSAKRHSAERPAGHRSSRCHIYCRTKRSRSMAAKRRTRPRSPCWPRAPVSARRF